MAKLPSKPRGTPAEGGAAPVVLIPEIREYPRINAEVVQLLDAGHRHIRVVGAEGHRLLLAGLAGGWTAEVEVEGRAGPELAADLDAPGLTVVCRGPAADGAARALRAGRVLILGHAGDAVGYTQRGGTVVVSGDVGARAGLDLVGGTLVLLGPAGRLVGERQAGGLIVARANALGPHAGLGRRGGRLVLLAEDGQPGPDALPDDATTFQDLMRELAPWLAPPAAT